MIVRIHVSPNAKNSQLSVIDSQNLEVKLDAKAEGGAANRRLIEMLSDHYKVPRSSITILKGLKSRDKIVAIQTE